MSSKFAAVIKNARNTYLREQDEGQQQFQQPQPDAAEPQPDQAQQPEQQPQQPESDPQAGYDVFRELTVNLLRVIASFAGAIKNNDEEQITALQKIIPTDLVQQIQQTTGQLATADPATTAQLVSGVLDSISSTPMSS